MEWEYPDTLPWIRFCSNPVMGAASWIHHQSANQVEAVISSLQAQRMIQSPFSHSFNSGTELGFTRLVSMIGMVMPGSLGNSQWYRASAAMDKSAADLRQEFVLLTMFYLSNNLCSSDDGDTWRSIADALGNPGLMTQKRRFDITSIQDITVQAFVENLFRVVVFYAVVRGDGSAKGILEWLLESNYDANSPVWESGLGITVTAVQLAILWRRVEILSLLLRHGGDANLRLSEFAPPLELAMHIALDADHGRPLHRVDQRDAIDMARILLKAGAKPDFTDQREQASFFSLLIGLGDFQFVREFLRKHPNINVHFRIKYTRGIIGEVTALTIAAGFKNRTLEAEAQNQTALLFVKHTRAILDSLPQATDPRDWITADVFIAAAAAGNYHVIKYLSRLSSNFRSSNAFEITPLHTAAQSRSCVTKEIISILLERGAEVDAQVEFDKKSFARQMELPCVEIQGWVTAVCSTPISPLKIALAALDRSTDWGCVAMLLDHRAKILGGEMCLVLGSRFTGRRVHELILDLLEAGADPNERLPDGQRAGAFLLTCKRGWYKLDLAKGLLDHGATLTAGDIKAALSHPAQSGDDERERSAVESMLLYRLLSLAAEEQQDAADALEVVILRYAKRSFLELYQRDYVRYDPAFLLAAVSARWNEEEIRQLLAKGADQGRFEADLMETTAIGIAVSKVSRLRNMDVAQLLTHSFPHSSSTCILPLRFTECGLDFVDPSSDLGFLRTQDSLRGSVLCYAVLSDDKEGLAYLIDCGYEQDWVTWLTLAHKNQTEMASILQQRHRAITIPDQFVAVAHEPFNLAIQERNAEMVRLLLSAQIPADVDYEIEAFRGRSPLQLAVEVAALDIIKILLDAGVSVNEDPAPDSGATALQLAAIKGYLGIAKLLLERGANVNAPGARRFGRTALEGAAEHGRIDMLMFLLESGAETTGTSRRQYIRSIKFAERMGHLTAARLLRGWQQWTDMDEEMMLEPGIMREGGYGSDEDGKERDEVCNDQGNVSPDVVMQNDDWMDEFVSWEGHGGYEAMERVETGDSFDG
ncbi:ankyrin repeat-containing domain protein [Podospora didyma]|uniref:Ankyrin repeat-containing domain protein n=1 Tax=Podospora didyma TaxID=330526 RepID=A0AAE0U5D1_9PEZI|nr:ankyrin repeat-containing domain protein [Podospora didyma]